MIIHNLTDRDMPYRPPRRARTLKLRGKSIPPGKSEEFPDNLPLADFAGWISSNLVSVDSVPEWYQAARRRELDETPALKEAKKAPEAEKVEKVEEPKVEVEVGAMDVTVTPGDDGELGTEDDEVEIKPKSKGRKKKRK